MKFSLKHLIIFVTFAAILCGVATYFYSQVVAAKRMAYQARAVAEAERDRAMQAAKAISSPTSSVAATDKQSFSYSILHWNIESGGNNPATIAEQLIALGTYDIIGLSEVAKPEVYEQAIHENWPNQYACIRGTTGNSDSLMVIYDQTKLELVENADIQEAGGVVLKNGRHRAPLYVRLRDKSNGQEVIVIQNHLARGDAEFRALQAGALREWARTKSTPMIAIGVYNFDYDCRTQKGNTSFDEFVRDGVWKWIEPVEMIDTNWSDANGVDRYPDSMLDFSFVAGAAKHWNAKCRVIVRDGDFPDDKMTSDHRPVELILRK